MPQSVLDGFEAETGYRVEQIYYETDELKEDLILQTGGQGMDLIIGSSDGFLEYISQGGVISPLVPELNSNYKHLNPIWEKRYPGLAKFASPMLWGTLGIVYRKDLVKHEVTSWSDLLNPAPALHGKILMVQEKRDAITPALKLLGYSSNETDYHHIEKAAKLLADQKVLIASYQYFDMSEDSELLTGSIWMALAYNGDALVLKRLNDNIEYVVPKEGTSIWADYIAVFETSSKKQAANQFINYINRPKIAAILAKTLSYASPNLAAEALLPTEFLNNKLIYPTLAVFQKSEINKPLKGRTAAYYNNLLHNIVTQ
jgi:spermidine/putrescine transport system substrate-binding protein